MILVSIKSYLYMAKVTILGRRLKEFRAKKKLTQEDLARKADIPFSTLSKIEAGSIKSPSVFLVKKIAEALGIKIDQLVN